MKSTTLEPLAFDIEPEAAKWFGAWIPAVNDGDFDARDFSKRNVRAVGWISLFLIIAALSAATVHSVKVKDAEFDAASTSPRAVHDPACGLLSRNHPATPDELTSQRCGPGS